MDMCKVSREERVSLLFKKQKEKKQKYKVVAEKLLLYIKIICLYFYFLKII